MPEKDSTNTSDNTKNLSNMPPENIYNMLPGGFFGRMKPHKKKFRRIKSEKRICPDIC